MEFEFQIGKHLLKIKMELYDKISNVDEIFRKFHENDIPHLFLDPSYVLIPFLFFSLINAFKDHLNKECASSFKPCFPFPRHRKEP